MSAPHSTTSPTSSFPALIRDGGRSPRIWARRSPPSTDSTRVTWPEQIRVALLHTGQVFKPGKHPKPEAIQLLFV